MLILRPHEPLILPPVPKFEWRTRSAAQLKDQFGNENQTRFRLRLRLNDGHVKWVGWFDDRDDFDAFLHAVVLQIDTGLPIPPAFRNYVIEEYGDPSYWPGMQYDFATVSFLTSPTGSNQTWTSPSDFDSAANTIEEVAGGGTGGARVSSSSSSVALGAGGGEYRKLTNFTVASPGTTTATYRIAASSAGVSVTQTGATVNSDGIAGNDSWWDGTTRAGSSLGAIGGALGSTSNGVTANGGAGGTGGNGGTGNAGGRGGNITANQAQPRATGGGGGGGPNGAGVAGADLGATGPGGTNGGAGDNGSGGAGSAGVSQATGGTTPPSNSSNGSNGTEWDASHGIGGGSGGCEGFWASTVATRGSGNGGSYGAASGGGCMRIATAGVVSFSGSSGQGMIVVTYTPLVAKGFPFLNLNPMSVMLVR